MKLLCLAIRSLWHPNQTLSLFNSILESDLPSESFDLK